MIANALEIAMNAPSAKWVDERSTYLGGTDIAAILGIHPYKTARGVYLDKKGIGKPVELNEAMVHGQNLEPYVADLYKRLTKRKLRKSRLYRVKHVPYLACNPDYEVMKEKRLLECKTAGFFAGQIFGEQGDAVPDQYLVQCMWQLAVTGREIVDLAVLIGGQDFRIYTIERDEEMISHLLSEASEWWNTYILADCPPPITGAEPDCQIVKDAYPQDNGDSIYATPDIETKVARLVKVMAAEKKVDEEKSRLQNEIKEYMGEVGTLDSELGTLTWKTNKNGSRTFKTNFKTKSQL